MQKAARMNRFFTDSSSKVGFADLESMAGQDGLLQHFILSRLAQTANSYHLFNQLADNLIRLAEHAYNLRDIEAFKEASQILMNLPISRARQVGLYYHALAIKRTGQRE